MDLDRDWVPKQKALPSISGLLLLLLILVLRLKPSSVYKFIIILSPVGAYYPQGINPVDIYVENQYVRAVPGGTGYAKTSANYAASMKAQAEAEEKGYVQVLWVNGKYVQEVGSMNVFFKIDGEVVTPELDGSILPGITRDSVIKLSRAGMSL